jgi:hypothetical protein
MAWTPPASTSLSSNDIRTVIDGLNGPHRNAALGFVDTITDRGYLYVIACELAWQAHIASPDAQAPADDLRAFIRDN